MGSNFWNNIADPLQPGTSIAQNTFTAAKDLPCGEFATNFPSIDGSTLSAGSHITIEAWGIASNTATPTLILGVYWGLVAGTALAISTAKTTTTAMSNWEWHLWYTGRVQGIGTATTGGSIIGSGYWNLPTSLTAWTAIRLPETAPAAVAIDTTVNKQLSIGATWSASSSSNTITCQNFLVDVHG
jgi:hypothetical protein